MSNLRACKLVDLVVHLTILLPYLLGRLNLTLHPLVLSYMLVLLLGGTICGIPDHQIEAFTLLLEVRHCTYVSTMVLNVSKEAIKGV